MTRLAKPNPHRDGQVPRSDPRHQATVPISLCVLIAEETAQPGSLTGKTIDLSAKGMKAHLDQLPHDLYRKLLQGRRSVHIEMLAATDEPIKFVGNVVWLDCHHVPGSANLETCDLGIALDERWSGPSRSRYASFIESIES